MMAPVGTALAFGVVVMVMSALLMRQRRVRSAHAVLANSTGVAGPADGLRDVAAEVAPVTVASAGVGTAVGMVKPGSKPRAEEPARGQCDTAEAAPRKVSAPVSAAVPFVVGPGVAKVEVLGPVRVEVAGKEVVFGRAEGRDLFALLATSKGGELSQTLIDRLWPQEGERGARRLETAIRDVNGAMRQATGLAAEVRFVVKAGPRRRLSGAYFDVDWWRFEDAYVQANTATDAGARTEALRLMVGLYQGPLLGERDDLWCLPLRQTALTQAVNAAERLAELERREDPDRAVDVLRLAVERIDRHSELLWCQLMTIQGELGRLPAVRRSFEQLTERLAEIDAKPSAQARQTYQRFIG